MSECLGVGVEFGTEGPDFNPTVRHYRRVLRSIAVADGDLVFIFSSAHCKQSHLLFLKQRRTNKLLCECLTLGCANLHWRGFLWLKIQSFSSCTTGRGLFFEILLKDKASEYERVIRSFILSLFYHQVLVRLIRYNPF